MTSETWTPLFQICPREWDHGALCHFGNAACVTGSLSMSGVHQGEEIPLLIVGSWSCTCQKTHQETERDRLIAWQSALALSLICFCFFLVPISRYPPPPIHLYHHHHHHLFLSCHMLKVEPVEVNDKQTTQGGWGGESEEWVDGWRWGHWKGGVWHKGEPVTLT